MDLQACIFQDLSPEEQRKHHLTVTPVKVLDFITPLLDQLVSRRKQWSDWPGLSPLVFCKKRDKIVP